MEKNILFVEDGSVDELDIEILRDLGIVTVTYRQGACMPTFETVNVGDEIIVTVTLKKGANAGGSLNKLYFTGGISSSLIIISKGNSVAYNHNDAVVIDTQEKLIEFINSEDRFYKYVKLVQPKAVKYNNYLRLFFGESVTTLSEQKINSYSPVFHTVTNDVYHPNSIECFENNASSKYSAPATSDDSFYAIFVGGNAYYHIFAVLEVESNG